MEFVRDPPFLRKRGIFVGISEENVGDVLRAVPTSLRNRLCQIGAQSPKSVIPSEAKESPGKMLRFGTAFQEIAASGFALLAMTAVINGWLIYNEMHP